VWRNTESMSNMQTFSHLLATLPRWNKFCHFEPLRGHMDVKKKGTRSNLRVPSAVEFSCLISPQPPLVLEPPQDAVARNHSPEAPRRESYRAALGS